MADEFFILKKDKVATKKIGGLTPRPHHRNESEIHIVAGSLWKIPYEDVESHRKVANLQSVDFDGVELPNFPVNSPEIQRLKKEQFDLLYAVPTCQDRFVVFGDRNWMAEAIHIHEGSIVYLVNLPGFVERQIPGKVRYKGSLTSENGTWFGIELSDEYRGKGTSDGKFRQKRYFTCHMDSAVFKPISRLAYCDRPDDFRESSMFYLKPGLNLPPSSIPAHPPLQLGEKVVWISDVGPEKAIVKWIGILPDAKEPIEWMVGVEFDKQVGTGTGKYRDQQLFKTRQGHASLVPVLGLMKQSEFYGFDDFLDPADSFPPPPPPIVSTSSTPIDEPDTFPDPPEETIPREATSPEADNRYEPTVDSSTTTGHMAKPYSAEPEHGNFNYEDASTVPMRDHGQYFGAFPADSTSALVTSRSESAHSLLEHNLENTQNHLSRFNDHEVGHFNTVHHSKPASQNAAKVTDTRQVSTTDRPVHHKYRQNNRYPGQRPATGICGEFVNMPPDRPRKDIEDKDTAMGIYDQHPYENVEHESGGATADSSEDIYEATQFIPPDDTFSDWEHIPRGVELNGQPKFLSTVDIRPNNGTASMGRFGAGSVDGLNRGYSKTMPYQVNTEPNKALDNRYDGNKATEVESPYELTDQQSWNRQTSHPSYDSATQRRANYQHSNTDPQKYSHGSDDFLNDQYHSGHRTAPGGTPVDDFSYLGNPNATMPLPRDHQPAMSLDYRNIKPKRSPKAKSVDDILHNKGSSEHEPCPRYTGNSVFYQPVARNDENITAEYRNLLEQEAMSGTTSPSTTEPHTVKSNATSRSNPTSRTNTVRVPKHNKSSSADDLDSGMSGLYNNSASTDPHSAEKQEYGRTYKVEDHRGNTRTYTKKIPMELTPMAANTDLEIGSTVEVVGNPENFRYGVIRWLGFLGDKNKPLVGLEMEMENNSCTDGTFGEFRLFQCSPKKAFFVFLSKVRKDGRFQENPDFVERRLTQAFGSLECPDIAGEVLIPNIGINTAAFLGKNRGIQGHHNSCYMDATLFSMFAFSTVFDSLLKPKTGSTAIKDKVQLALREGIVNPLRRQFYVRADKIMNLRMLLDKHSEVQGLTHAEKDPEEFLNSLLQDILKAGPFIHLSSGLQSYLYTMILERDDQIVLPTTQQLLGLSFLQSNLKLTECPEVLILQMPRCGKKYKMYQRIVPSLTLDITDILDQVPRECTICSSLATFECTDCFKHFGDGSLLDITFCDSCLEKSHKHVKRASHNPTRLNVPQVMIDRYMAGNHGNQELPRVTMELFAVICIETSHYVTVVRAGADVKSPWLFFDSMADRMGQQHGYNVPQVKPCRELPEWLRDVSRERILSCKDDRDLPEHLKRVLCDGYICMYQRRRQPNAPTTDNTR